MTRGWVSVVVIASVPLFAARAQAQGPGGSATSQCAAEVQQRHHDIVAGLQGHPTHEIAQAIVDSDAKNPSVAECAQKKRGGGGGGGDDTVPAATSGTGDPALDEVNADIDASLQKILDNATFANAPPNPNPNPSPNPNTKKIVIGAAAGGGLATILAVSHGGGGTSGGGTTGGGSTGGGTGGGGGTPAAFNPPGQNSPPPYKGDAIVDTTAFGPSANAFCTGSDQKYGETVSVNLNASGSGTVTLDDTPGFQRVYNVSGVTALGKTVTASGTFSLFGAPIPGTLSVTFNSTTSVTIRETTNYGSCSNTYSGTMTR